MKPLNVLLVIMIVNESIAATKLTSNINRDLHIREMVIRHQLREKSQVPSD